MRFDKLNEVIPYVVGGKPKILRYSPYNAITLRFPGRHAQDTTPVGGDFVVCVDDEAMDWTEHQFSHDDIFLDLELKRNEDADFAKQLMVDYYAVVANNAMMIGYFNSSVGVHPTTFLAAVQCLAVAEHRRYAKYETQFGGRYLPLRFAAGIVEGLWSAADAMAWQRKGRPGVERLEKEFGTPLTTAPLFAKVGS
jgi:hypothetical protein